MGQWPVYDGREEEGDDPRPRPQVPVPQPKRSTPTWETYDERPGAAPSPARPLPPPRVPLSRGLTGLGLGSGFDDRSWRAVLRRRGWRETEVNGLPGFESGSLADGSTVLLCIPELSTGGLDDTPFIFGFRHGSGQATKLWRVIPHGDGELVFDRLAHAGGAFDQRAFLSWLKNESMADATQL